METYIGIDVSKNDLDIYSDETEKAIKIKNDLREIKAWLRMIKSQKENIKLVICEATGGYETLIVDALKQAQFPVHVVHANKVRHFAKTTGSWVKTDKIDSRLLAWYARLFQPQADGQKISPEAQTLKLLIKRRQQLIKQKVEENNRLDKSIPLWMKESIQTHIKWLRDQIKEFEKTIQSHIDTHSPLQQQITLLVSIPGIGLLTACALLAGIPELGALSSKALSALIGVAPFNKDSGKISKKRFIQGGRSNVRSALYMATVASLIHNPYVKNFYNQLKAKGKPSKVAIVACMRKLLTILNAVAKRQTPWVQKFE